MNEINLNVEGMMCGGCEKRIENALGDIKGVKNVKANHEEGTVKIESGDFNAAADVTAVKAY